MRILLVYPRFQYLHAGGLQEPLGILYIASVLRNQGHFVSLFDCTFKNSLTQLDEYLLDCDIIGFSATTALFDRAKQILQRIRKIRDDIPCIIGGPHATVMPEECLESGFDFCVIGEGEQTIIELVEAIASGSPTTVRGIAWKEGGSIKINEFQPFTPDLDIIPFPARGLLDYECYFSHGLRSIGIISSRGCPYNCLFCKPMQDKLFGRKVRIRSALNVVKEIKHVFETFEGKCNHFFFKDDTFTCNGIEWFRSFNKQLREKQLDIKWVCQARVDRVDEELLAVMKDAGCRGITFGVESGSQRILNYYRKGITIAQIEKAFSLCHEIGIEPAAYIMIGAPDEKREDISQTIGLLFKLRPCAVMVSIVTPAPGTDLYTLAKERNILNFKNSVDCDYYQASFPMQLDYLSKADLAKYREFIQAIPPICRQRTQARC